MNNRNKENGYVLVVIIGILTILSLMTITFATLSRIETRATRNYTDSVKCEKIAKAGLEHAIYELWLDKFGTDTLAYNDPSYDENYDASGTSWPGDGVFDGSDYDNSGNGTADSQWIYFPLTAEAATSTTAIRLPGNLLARYAVLITDDREARININVTGNKAGGPSHTSNEGWSTFENDLSYVIEQAPGLNSTDGDNIASDIIDTRFGTDTASGTSATNDDSGIVPDPLTDSIDNDGDWDPTTDDSNNNEIPDSGETNVNEPDEVTDEPNEFNSISPYGDDIPLGLLSETEIIGTSSYTSRLETIFNNRGVSQSDQEDFLKTWLTTYSADTIVCPPYSLDSGTSTTMLNINALVNNEGAYTSGTYDPDKKAQMLVEVLTAGGVPDVERQQIAVNIIDFVDSNGTVTAYNDGSNTYYGVEKTPYINEVEAEVNGATSAGNGKFIELFNPYDTTINLANWTITGTTMNQVTLTGTIGSQTYYVIADNAQAYVTDFNYNSSTTADQYDALVNGLTTTGEVLTFKDDNNIIVQITNYGNADSTTNTKQLNDPRPIPLTASASDPWEWTTGAETAGQENQTAIFNPGDGNDGWSDITWKPSFLVADRRFSNRGYLGFIHRGIEWSSVRVGDTVAYPIDFPNLLDYITITDPSMDYIDNDGDGDIDADDTGTQTADIDGKEYRIPGLINVNTAPEEVLLSLPNVDATIANKIFTSGQKPFTSIRHLVDNVTEITDTSATNKWGEEKIFRSISNLITTRSNVFTVYVTAQITDEAISSVYAEKRILAIVDRSIDPIKVRYFRWITE